MANLRTPTALTLKKYGLSVDEWRAIADRQGGVCAVCEKLPKSLRLHIDHDHIKGWKKLPPEKRKLHVRGLVCHWCNRSYVGRCITIAKSENVTAYLRAHAERMIAWSLAKGET